MDFIGTISIALIGLYLLYKLGVVKAVSTATEGVASITEVYVAELVDRAEFDTAREAGKRVVKAAGEKQFAKAGDWKKHLQSTTE